MAENRTGNAIKNSGASLIQKFVNIIIQFAIRTTFIHILGNEYTGIAGLFTDILHVLSLMELGLDSSMIFSLYEPLAQKDRRRISALLKFYRSAFNIIGFLVLAAGLALTPFLPYIINGVPGIKENIRIIFMMYVATSAFSYFLIYKSVLLRADQKSRIIAKWTTLVQTIECIIEIILLVALKKYYAYLIVHFFATIGRNILVSFISSRKYPEYFEDTNSYLTKEERIKLYRDLACLTVYNMAGVVINSTDSVFISAFVGTVEVAIIGNFTLIISSIRTIFNQVVNAVKPSIGNLAATSSDDKQEQVFRILNFLTFWVCCFSCTCLFILLNPFIGDIWFDASYKVSTLIIGVLVANFFIAVMVFPIESFRTANGLFVQGWMRPAIMAVLNILLDFLLGKIWGIFGIFIATTISRLMTQVWYDPWLVYKNVFRRNVIGYYLRYIYYACITLCSCLLAFMLCSYISTGFVLIDFMIKIIVGVIIPNSIIIVIYSRTVEFHFITELVRSLIKK